MKETSLKVEYLVIINTLNDFCSNEETFNNLLKTNSKINVQRNKIIFKNINVEYKLQTQIMENKSERFFHIHLKYNDKDKLHEFEELLKLVRDILHKVSNNIQIIWDDTSFYYSQQAYPLIYEIENLMRKLITKFMLTNIGLGWVKDNIPEEVKASVRISKKEETEDYLYKTDFIQLANFLFKEYSPNPTSTLLEKLKEAKDLSELSLEEMKEFVPQSNWGKYFSRVVECEGPYLQKRWSKLYDLRNKIAHNSQINKKEFEEIQTTVNEIKVVINRAIGILDKIHVPEKEKDLVAENIAIANSDHYFSFINSFKTVEKLLFMIGRQLGFEGRSSKATIEKLFEKGLIDTEIIKEFNNILSIRNIIVHENEVEISEYNINEWNLRCEKVGNLLFNLHLKMARKKGK